MILFLTLSADSNPKLTDKQDGALANLQINIWEGFAFWFIWGNVFLTLSVDSNPELTEQTKRNARQFEN